jgi:hypothetical protein
MRHKKPKISSLPSRNGHGLVEEEALPDVDAAKKKEAR